MRPKPENCSHAKSRTTEQGFSACKRCLTDTSDPKRARSYVLSPRVVLEVDTLVSISNSGRGRDYGRFKYAEITTNPNGPETVSIAVLCHEKGSNGRPISCGWRFVHPERIRRAKGG